jgi:hypothetical protein
MESRRTLGPNGRAGEHGTSRRSRRGPELRPGLSAYSIDARSRGDGRRVSILRDRPRGGSLPQPLGTPSATPSTALASEATHSDGRRTRDGGGTQGSGVTRERIHAAAGGITQGGRRHAGEDPRDGRRHHARPAASRGRGSTRRPAANARNAGTAAREDARDGTRSQNTRPERFRLGG